MKTAFYTRFRKFVGNAFLVLLVAVCIPYSNTFLNGFVGDDPDFIIDWKEIKPPADIKSLMLGQVPKAHVGTYRPLRSVYYAGTQYIFGQNVIYYHVFAIFIHFICTWLVYKLALQLTNDKVLALFTGLIFAVHPVHTEAITFITTSFDIVGIIWALLSILFYTKPNRKLFHYVSSLLFFILAIFSYEITLVIPLILLLYHWLLDKKNLSFMLRSLPLVSFFYFIIFYFYIRINLLHIPSRGGYIDNTFLTSLYVSIKQIPIYLLDAFLPIHIGLDHAIPPNAFSYNLPQFLLEQIMPISLVDPYFIFSGLLLLSSIFLVLKLRHTKPLISFCISFILISLLPILNLFPGFLIMFEKYVYLGSFASSLLIALLLYTFKQHKIRFMPLSTVLLLIILILFSFKTFVRNFDWKTDISLWESTVRQSPENAMIWYQLGSAYQQSKDFETAAAKYETALQLNDDMYFVHTNIGICLYETGNSQAALPHLEKAMSQYDKAKEAYLYLGKIYIDYKDYASALHHLQKALDIDPGYTDAKAMLLRSYNEFGNALVEYGSYKEAERVYNEALKLDSSYKPARDNLSNLMMITKP